MKRLLSITFLQVASTKNNKWFSNKSISDLINFGQTHISFPGGKVCSERNVAGYDSFGPGYLCWTVGRSISSLEVNAYLQWSKNSIERLMISSSVIILLSSSATSPRSSFDPLEAAGKVRRKCCFKKEQGVQKQSACSETPTGERFFLLHPKRQGTLHRGERKEIKWGHLCFWTHHLQGAPHKSLSAASFHLHFRKTSNHIQYK